MGKFMTCAIAVIVALGMFGASGQAFAADAVENQKPFAEKRIVLQLSDPNPFKQTLALNVANNLIKHYGPDKVEVEIVAFGPGLRLLYADNANTSRLNSAAMQGVRFSACSNTMAKMTKVLGHPPELNSNAKLVGAGVVRIIALVDAGYQLIKP